MKEQIYLVFASCQATEFTLALAKDDKEFESNIDDPAIGFIQLNHLPTNHYNEVMGYLVECTRMSDETIASIKILLKYKGTHDKH